MKHSRLMWVITILLMLICTGAAVAQSTTATISGTVSDERQGVLPGAMVTAKNIGTNTARSASTDTEGRYRFPNLQIGQYEITVEARGFARHVRSGVELTLNQAAVVDFTMKPSTVQDVVLVTENVTLLNTSNAEVGVKFDSKRISELPVSTNRNVFSIALSAPGVSELGSGQTGFANGVNFSANGMRVRSNNFMIDGQDSNDPSVSGAQQPVNNPDIVQEIQLITNQFNAEYGRNAGSVMNVVTKSGSNGFHGSAFWFHNSNKLNALSNLDKRAGRTRAPFRIENQIGGTVGGPIIKDKTFFFGSYQKWTDRALGSGFTLNGAPTAAGRQVLQTAAGNRPQVVALLKFLPAAQSPIAASAKFVLNGQTFTVPLGSLTGSSSNTLDNDQWFVRADHNFNSNHKISGSYTFAGGKTAGSGQVTPPGLTTVVPSRTQSANVWWTGVLGPKVVNEVRFAWQRLGTRTTAFDPTSEEIPSIEISELGLTGFNAAASRTAIGLAVNLPQFRFNNTYQIQDNLSYTAGSHATKFGLDVRRVEVKSFFFPTIRGLLRYPTLQAYVDDLAEAANINKPLAGGDEIQYYEWHDWFFYAQDEWKVRPNFTLNFGLRYETPGNSIASLLPTNQRIVQAAGGDQRYALSPVPRRDRNNLQPRFGFNWHPRTSADGMLGFITGGDKLVLRGGYSRTNDYAFININLNIASAFPFVAAISLPTSLQPNGAVAIANAYTRLPAAQPAGLNPNTLTRTIVGEDFRSPAADQYNLEVSREMSRNVVLRVGYVATKGSALFQTIDGNPRLPFSSTTRVDPTREVIRLRANAASSIYHSMQVSLDKRLSQNFSAGIHYTWSTYIDDASEIFNPSSGEVAVSQDSFNRRADRARSSYDRPHRLTGNFVYELPFFRNQPGAVGRILGGWQFNSSFTFQSGAPFTVLNGSDPTGALSGINSLVGDAIRPNLNTNQKVSSMNVIELLQAGGASLFRRLGTGERVGTAGRNILRADGINRVDFGILKNIKFFERQTLQVRADFFNLTNTRDFGIPEGRVNSANFLNQWGTNGGNRRIIMGLRYTF